jgi:O-Antigen ligase
VFKKRFKNFRLVVGAVANSIEPINLRSTGGNHLTTSQIGIRFIAPAAGCLLALFVGWFVSSDANPFTTTTILTATVMFIVAVCNPTGGVYFLILTSGYLDLVKRLGVLSDALSGIDVVITLAVAPLLFVCVCLGVVYRNVINRAWLKPWQIVLAVVILTAMAGVFVQAFFRGGGALFALKDFANSGAYLPLTLVVCLLFPDTIRVRRLVTFCLWVYVPVGLYGVWQQFFGLTDFEIDYLKSGFTIEVGLLDDVRLRPFATLNSPHALGVVTAMLSALAAFTPLKQGKWTRWQIFVSLLFAIACLATFIRAAWALLAFAVLVWACCRSKVGTIALYGMALVGFAALMFNSEAVLRSLDQIETYLPQDSDVESQAFRLGTFSDRLVSFRNVLTNPEFHTWFGNRNEVYEDSMEQSHENGAHDQIGQILVSFGFTGLFFFLGVTVLGLVVAHRAIFRQRDPIRRRMMLGCLSVLIATLFSGMLFGSHLGVFPVNIFFALLAGCFCSLNMSPERLVVSTDAGKPIALSKEPQTV